jgi:hypothetical protein
MLLHFLPINISRAGKIFLPGRRGSGRNAGRYEGENIIFIQDKA